MFSWYLAALRKYADFRGRARRREYWYFGLINFMIILIIAVPGLLLAGPDPQHNPNPASYPFELLYLAYIIAVVVPSLAVSVRRLHDVGRSGWWLLLALVPFVGGIVLFYFHVLDSEPGDNKWGPNPKSAEVAQFVAP